MSFSLNTGTTAEGPSDLSFRCTCEQSTLPLFIWFYTGMIFEKKEIGMFGLLGFTRGSYLPKVGITKRQTVISDI